MLKAYNVVSVKNKEIKKASNITLCQGLNFALVKKIKTRTIKLKVKKLFQISLSNVKTQLLLPSSLNVNKNFKKKNKIKIRASPPVNDFALASAK